MSEPHWERGFRCHGYWIGGNRVGCVSLPPRLPELNSYAKTGFGYKPVHHRPVYGQRSGFVGKSVGLVRESPCGVLLTHRDHGKDCRLQDKEVLRDE